MSRDDTPELDELLSTSATARERVAEGPEPPRAEPARPEAAEAHPPHRLTERQVKALWDAYELHQWTQDEVMTLQAVATSPSWRKVETRSSLTSVSDWVALHRETCRKPPDDRINNVSAMSEQSVLLRFGRGQAATDVLQAVVDEALTELADDAQARAVGVSPVDLAGVTSSVAEDRHGADPTVAAIVVAVAGGLTKDAALRLWDNVLWPRIKRRLGAKAVGPRRDD